MEQIFDKIGKKTPYTVPAGYFETISKQIADKALEAERTEMQKLAREPKLKVLHAPRRLKLWIPASAAAAAVLIVCLFQFNPMQKGNPQAEYDMALNDYCNSLSDDNGESLDGMLADVDLFWQYQE